MLYRCVFHLILKWLKLDCLSTCRLINVLIKDEKNKILFCCMEKMIFSMQQKSYSRKFIYFCLDVIVRRQSPVFISIPKWKLFTLIKHTEVKKKNVILQNAVFNSISLHVGVKVNLSNSTYLVFNIFVGVISGIHCLLMSIVSPNLGFWWK